MSSRSVLMFKGRLPPVTKTHPVEAREMGQQLRSPWFSALTLWLTTICHSSSRGSDSVFLTLEDTRHTCDAHTAYIAVGKAFLYLK